MIHSRTNSGQQKIRRKGERISALKTLAYQAFVRGKRQRRIARQQAAERERHEHITWKLKVTGK
jgi:hypothetical protein